MGGRRSIKKKTIGWILICKHRNRVPHVKGKTVSWYSGYVFIDCSLPLWSKVYVFLVYIFFFPAEVGIRHRTVTGVQTCALPISDAVQPDHDAEIEQRQRQHARLGEGVA